MNWGDSLNDFTLDELLKTFSQINIVLMEAKLNNDVSMVQAHQSTLETIQEAIIKKRASEQV